MFPGFRTATIDVGEVAIRAVAGGGGAPLQPFFLGGGAQ